MVATYTHHFDTPLYKGNLTIHTGLYIDGKWVDPIEGGDLIDKYTTRCPAKHFANSSCNVANGKVITAVAGAGTKDIDAAVKAARKAYKTSWGLKVPGAERGKLLDKLADLIEKHQDQLAALEALNVGKHYHMARNMDIAFSVRTLRYYAGWSDKIQGKTIETNDKKLAYTRHEPWGVVGAIVPWNFPLMMAITKLGPALATGNVVVLKPSEVTPLTVLYLADLLSEAGFPPGVVNVVNGYGNTIGSAISAHPSIEKVAFTGSTLVGRKILKAASESNLKAVTLELGGKSPTIVFDDANLDQASCIAGSRVYVQEGIYDKFLEGFTQAAQGLKKEVGPFEEGVHYGPQVSRTHFDRVMGYISSGKSEGAKVHIGGEREGEQGYFIKPTVFVDAKPDMRIMQEEIFGPVCSIVKFKTEEEMTEWANNTTYGLAANVLTENIARGIRMANALEAGCISVNCASAPELGLPFGGYKQSGLGREMGEAALHTYTQLKAVHVNIGQVL
ncbi:NAD-dependent aldehyde dehydrogenase [Macrolepiota fuliginosa MF-IS2]|uniref:NAD-dependent aldehyde dehydrogenase n=1 Tax=Macrolepiota fuliginosa MF-IS2 TaxID=1400762 RepID=A0A9P5XA94_9AGAR|nr:NAD-dependent aldehyde dehydrogenase [Macrolepiota fuliginosa MF-IS2]